MPLSFLMVGYSRAVNRVLGGGDHPRLLMRYQRLIDEADIESFSLLEDDVSPAAVLAAVYEALNWSVLMTDAITVQWKESRAGEWRDNLPDAGFLWGLRYARNQSQHQWLNVLAVGKPLDGFTRMDAPEVIWRSRLGEPDRRYGSERGRRAYEHHLAGHSVIESLSRALPAFAQVVLELDRGPSAYEVHDLLPIEAPESHQSVRAA